MTLKPQTHLQPKLLTILFSILPLFSIAQQPLRIWYTSPAAYWEACIPLGNGHLGVMPDGGIFHEKIVLNDITLWSGGKQDADRQGASASLPEIRKLIFEGKNIEAQNLMSKTFICQGKGSGNGNGANVPYGSYQLLGNLNIHYLYDADSMALHPVHYTRDLILDKALASTSFAIGNTKYRREYYCSFDDDVIVLKLSASEIKKISFSVNLNRPEKAIYSASGTELQMQGQLNNGTDGKGMKYMVRLKIKLQGGSLFHNGNSFTVKNANEAIIYISAATDFRDKAFLNASAKSLAHALGISYAEQKQQHIRHFQRLFKRASITLAGDSKDSLPTDLRLKAFAADPGDNGLPALYFQFGRYLLISSTRPGLLAPNLQGLWANTLETPWNGDYHLNINIQMNNWPLDLTNLGELNQPFFTLVRDLVKPGEKTANYYYGTKGWVAHTISNVWGYTSPAEDYSWGSFNTGSAWLCQMLWTHYEFSGDKSYLEKLYPIMKGSAEFYLSSLVKEPSHGWLVTSPSSSPENAFLLPDGNKANVCDGPTIDNQLIRFLFSACIQSCSILKKDPEFKNRLKKAIVLLPPNQIGKDGRIMEWLEEYGETEIHHRHVSHLWGLYPGTEINATTPKLEEAAKKSLETRGDEGTGWSLAWKINFWARLHEGNHSFSLLQKLLRPVSVNAGESDGSGSYINLFCAHAPFQIDGNFGGTAGIAEMLFQSGNGYIEFLPALPDEWKEGSFSGLKARGGAEVSARWKNSELSQVSIKTNRNQILKIKIPPYSKVSKVLTDGKDETVKTKDQFLTLLLKKGVLTTISFSRIP